MGPQREEIGQQMGRPPSDGPRRVRSADMGLLEQIGSARIDSNAFSLSPRRHGGNTKLRRHRDQQRQVQEGVQGQRGEISRIAVNWSATVNGEIIKPTAAPGSGRRRRTAKNTASR